MIKNFQKKFIIISILVLFCVFALFFGLVNIVSYHSIDKRASETIDVILNNDGKIPFTDDVNEEFSPEFEYETRFFSVYIPSNEGTAIINVDKIASISKETALKITKQLISLHEAEGYIGYFKFKSKSIRDGKLYVFLDCTRTLSIFNTIFVSSITLSIISILILFIIFILFSGKAVKPFVDNYNKQKQFITNASHEIKTPLAIIKATTEVIEIENGKTEWTDSLNQQIAKLNDLTDKLVFLTRMDEKSTRDEFKNFSISDLATEIAEPYTSVAKTKNYEYIIKIEKDIEAYGNISLIGQVISILLDNAFKYTNDNGFIEISLAKYGKETVLSLVNSVDYIETGNLSKLFDRFYRGDSSRNSSSKGFGIGLSIAESIVNLHGGKITAKSIDGKSVEFNVIL